jgi:hypothetical protein
MMKLGLCLCIKNFRVSVSVSEGNPAKTERKFSRSFKKIDAILLFKTGSLPVILFSLLNSMLKEVDCLLEEEDLV